MFKNMFNNFMYHLGRFSRKAGFQQDDSNEHVQQMRETINRLGGINFRIEKAPSGEWVAESTNIDGIITGGKNYPQDMNEQIKDAVHTFFEIPPQLCSENKMKLGGEVTQVEEVVYA